MRQIPHSEFLPMREAAARLGYSRGHAYRLASQGLIPSVRFGVRSVRVPRAAFEAWLVDQTEDALASVSPAIDSALPEMNLARLRLGLTVFERPGLARRLRERSGLSQGDLAAIIGATDSGISKYELGDRRPSGEVGRRYLVMLAELAADGLPDGVLEQR